MAVTIKLAERGLIPDSLIRSGIQKLLRERLAEVTSEGRSDEQWVALLESRPLAEATDAANAQHYEVPADYFKAVLGPQLKYSCAYWSENCAGLEAAETEMLRLTCERARLDDGQRVLELGCGWGSLSLWMAEKYPKSEITAISNSNSQRIYIEGECARRGIGNLRVETCDINNFQPEGTFDRVVSVEMFEHVRNHRVLLGRIAKWLKLDGFLFVHIFTHRKATYLFEAKSSKDWMSQYFFTGGIMPSANLLPTAAAGKLTKVDSWSVNGLHYSKTLEAWLARHDERRDPVMAIFRKCYGRDAKLWFQRWRIFYLACSELFGFSSGEEWAVTHYLFAKQSDS